MGSDVFRPANEKEYHATTARRACDLGALKMLGATRRAAATLVVYVVS
jgi:hypothetical protein